MDVPKHPETSVGTLHTKWHDTQAFSLSAASYHIDFTSHHSVKVSL